jgi:hypothetical protein
LPFLQGSSSPVLWLSNRPFAAAGTTTSRPRPPPQQKLLTHFVGVSENPPEILQHWLLAWMSQNLKTPSFPRFPPKQGQENGKSRAH